jgi:uncharacterized protein YgiM (DUF1202 family)
MSSKNYPVMAVIFLLIASACYAETPVGEVSSKPIVPYQAVVVGKGVDVMAEPKVNTYSCGKVSAPDQVTVVNTQGNWAKIFPPRGSFSWISKDYVKVESSGIKIGLVTGNSVKVYAGAEGLSPLHSPKQQTSLNEGEHVALLGTEKKGYYKIVPPVGAYLWIKLSNIKYFGAIEKRPIKPSDFAPIPAPALTPIPKPKPGVTKTVGPDTFITPDVKPVIPDTVKPSPVSVTNEDARLKECYAIKDRIETEKQKDIDQQDYSAIVKQIKAIIADKNAGKARRYAKYEMDMVERFKLAVEAGKLLKQQDEELAKTLKEIEEKYLEKTSRIPVTAKFTVSGVLKKSHIYTARHSQQRFLIIDKGGKIICYALPTNSTAKNNALELLDKKVGIKGIIGKDPDNAVTVISFDEVVDITEK